jgi:sporulation protein YlmC with PRC-barrel domain
MKTNQMIVPLVGVLCIALTSLSRAEDKGTKVDSPTLVVAQADRPIPPQQPQQPVRAVPPDQDPGRADPAATPLTGSPGARPMKLNKVSNLIGITVEDPQGENLGEIEDIVVDLQRGHVSYAVMSSGGVLGVGKKLLAVPLTAFTRNADESALVLQADKDSIGRAEGLTDNAWPALENPSFGAMPFWKNPHGTDPSLTPTPQGDRNLNPANR